MEEKRGFNQIEYIKEYNKKHYKTFKVDLKKEEYDETEKILKEKHLKKSEFLRKSIENLKNNKFF